MTSPQVNNLDMCPSTSTGNSTHMRRAYPIPLSKSLLCPSGIVQSSHCNDVFLSQTRRVVSSSCAPMTRGGVIVVFSLRSNNKVIGIHVYRGVISMTYNHSLRYWSSKNLPRYTVCQKHLAIKSQHPVPRGVKRGTQPRPHNLSSRRLSWAPKSKRLFKCEAMRPRALKRNIWPSVPKSSPPRIMSCAHSSCATRFQASRDITKFIGHGLYCKLGLI
jgi:hypothetical protein